RAAKSRFSMSEAESARKPKLNDLANRALTSALLTWSAESANWSACAISLSNNVFMRASGRSLVRFSNRESSVNSSDSSTPNRANSEKRYAAASDAGPSESAERLCFHWLKTLFASSNLKSYILSQPRYSTPEGEVTSAANEEEHRARRTAKRIT